MNVEKTRAKYTIRYDEQAKIARKGLID
jgi:hypothetical protein